MHVIALADERVGDEVGVGGDERQIFGVLGGQRRESQSCVGEIDALALGQLLSFRARLRNLYDDLFRSHVADHAADLPVVEPDRFARPHVPEHLWERDAYARRLCQAPLVIADGRTSLATSRA